MPQSILLASLDPARSAMEQWMSFSNDTKKAWVEYFHLRPVTSRDIARFPHYTHPYQYTLTNDIVAQTVFCLVVGILQYNLNHGMTRAFVGNSGGLDSATIVALLARVAQLSHDIGKTFDVYSYGLPIKSNPEHNDRASETARTFGLHHITIEGLDDVFHTYERVLSPLAGACQFNDEEKRRAFGNVKARIRMIVNFFGTTKAGGYVVSTDNLTELYMAFWTLMGDVGAFGPIQNILKGLELPFIAYALGVPDRTLAAKPTDGLEVHQSLDTEEGGDTDAFKGVYYPHVDAIICHGVKQGLRLDASDFVAVDGNNIQSDAATQDVVDALVKQMVSPASVWKRTKGSIGSAIHREEIGLLPLSDIAGML